MSQYNDADLVANAAEIEAIHAQLQKARGTDPAPAPGSYFSTHLEGTHGRRSASAVVTTGEDIAKAANLGARATRLAQDATLNGDLNFAGVRARERAAVRGNLAKAAAVDGRKAPTFTDAEIDAALAAKRRRGPRWS